MSELAKYEMTGGNIKNALLNAATRASLRSSNDGERKEVTMEDLVFACTAEMSKKNKPEENLDRSHAMYS